MMDDQNKKLVEEYLKSEEGAGDQESERALLRFTDWLEEQGGISTWFVSN